MVHVSFDFGSERFGLDFWLWTASGFSMSWIHACMYRGCIEELVKVTMRLMEKKKQ